MTRAAAPIAPAFCESVPEHVRTVVIELAREPGFDPLRQATEVDVLPGGASNLNLDVRGPAGRFVLRIAEQDVERFGIDRVRAAAANRLAAEAGLAPPLAATKLPEGHCLSRFVDGVVLGSETVRAADRIKRAAAALRRLHGCGEIAGRWSVFDDVRRNVGTARREGLELPADMDELLARMRRVEELFDGLGIPDGLCHNDLQIQNFIDGGGRLWIVDWEYAAMGNPYFDLGGFGVNAELDEAEEGTFLTAYFGVFRETELARVRLMQLMSAVREATWAVIAAPVLAHDWDYAAWAAEYFDRARSQSGGDVFERRLDVAAGEIP